jgi:hypothetical protein
MNERIKLLAEQAGYTKDMFGIGHWDMPECQKFAELILREGYQVVTSIPTISTSLAGRNMLNHFGVEE